MQRPVIAGLLPPPRRFHEVLHLGKGSTRLYVWQADPADDDFVALGMVVTVSSGDAATPPEPSPDEMRCVPRAGCERAGEGALEEVWRDGLSGGLWRVRQTGLLVAGQGTAAPEAMVLKRRLETEEPPPLYEVGPMALLQALFDMS